MTTYKVERASDSEDLARRAAQRIASHIDLVLDQRDRVQIALSGGSTPAIAYRLLGQERLPWDRVDVFLGDERWVDASDEASNARMLRATLLAEGPGSQAAFHPVPTVELTSPEASAEAYATMVQEACGGNPP
ncbi:MAG TPA: 6-phosphogluconolactonase, partial [Prochlorococcus sp.]|nr:6-phosphogluconolactonase [Prochlorococcus sp.]